MTPEEGVSLALQHQSLLEANANRPDAAIQLISRAIAINPNVADLFVNLAEFQRRIGQFDSAIASLRHAIQLQPTHAIAHYNLGVVFAEQHKADEALGAYERAVALKPDFLEAQIRLGNELRRRRRFEESAAAFRAAIQSRPDSPEAHWNYSLLLLQTGDFEAGWREYEWRRHIETICPPRNFPQPEWRGEPLNGQTVFLHIEQAFGDILQFARFAPKIAQRGGRAILQSPSELLRLFRSLQGVDQLISTNDPITHCFPSGETSEI